MKTVRISPAAAATLTDILEFSIERWGLARAEKYKNQLLRRIEAVACGEPPHPKSCETLMRGKRNVAGLCYCLEGRHFIVFRASAACIEVVEFFHHSRDLAGLIDRLSPGNKK